MDVGQGVIGGKQSRRINHCMGYSLLDEGQSGIFLEAVRGVFRMFFLAGLLGMMALGSVVIVTTSQDDDDLQEADGYLPEDENVDAGGATSLFQQMGLIKAGTDGDDTLPGSNGPDALIGLDGDDVIDGGADDDALRGNGGDDTVLGGTDDDVIHGDGGDDLLDGGTDDDEIYGHHGDDAMIGGDGSDHLVGGLGDDLMLGGLGDDALGGRDGADSLDGGLGEDTLFGGFEDDVLSGVVRGADGVDVDDRDFLNGGDGADTIGIGSGDVVTAGEGADVLVLGDWIDDEAAGLLDFDESEDQLLIVYDDSDAGADPELEMRPSQDDPAMTEIVMDGTVLATLPTSEAPSLESVVLVAESLASDLPFG